MRQQCPECGAPWHVPQACTEQFNQFLALEFSDPEYGIVHHLTVPSYMLQHPSQLSREGWHAMRGLLSAFLESGLTPSEVRRRERDTLDSGNRDWSMKRGPRLHLPDGFTWSHTILDVSDATPDEYRTAIERWARQVLADSATLVEKVNYGP